MIDAVTLINTRFRDRQAFLPGPLSEPPHCRHRDVYINVVLRVANIHWRQCRRYKVTRSTTPRGVIAGPDRARAHGLGSSFGGGLWAANAQVVAMCALTSEQDAHLRSKRLSGKKSVNTTG
ncbi:hypothetical protein [Kutzneria sp. NPDC052558]|uniref:hypothetical protein n=1 Tax=Kutzneria sp. NPDC052558 TaxID=3364121 RepID=UPI0037CCB9A4